MFCHSVLQLVSSARATETKRVPTERQFGCAARTNNVGALNVESNVLAQQATDLVEGNEYQFRIVAVNKVGEGEPGPASQPITARDPWEKPGRPGIPDITAVNRDKISLKWRPPKDDGGSPIFNYVIEYRVEGEFSVGELKLCVCVCACVGGGANVQHSVGELTICVCVRVFISLCVTVCLCVCVGGGWIVFWLSQFT